MTAGQLSWRMSKPSFVVGVVMLVLASTAWAGQAFECGGARVTITVVSKPSGPMEERARTTIAVTRDGAVRELSYVGGIDFVGGHCVKAADGRPLVVFQAYCGGSGCQDLDNWGIVDPRSLQVLLAPHDGNRKEAQRILGGAPVAPRKMLSVEREGEASGKRRPGAP